MSALRAIVRRELALRLRGGGWAAGLGLFVGVGALSPLALGTDADTLAVAGPAILWVAAIFAVLIGFEGQYEEDLLGGGFEVYALSPCPLSLIVLIRLICASLVTGVPLVLAAPVLLAGFGISDPGPGTLALALALPGVTLIAGAIGALCAGLRRGTALVVFLALPLLAPPLVFGPAAAGGGGTVPLLTLGAFSLQALAICPFVAAAGIRSEMS